MKNVRILTALVLILTLVITLVACGCKHSFEDGACTKCGDADPDYIPPCEHSFADGACTKCGETDPDYIPPCEHSFADGACTKCGEADPDYVPPCEHSFADGACTKCGEPCVHEYSDGVCAVCGAKCIHRYVDGACYDCGLACPHIYINSVCAKCDQPCTHSYTEGVCDSCGASDPDYIPADMGRSLYERIVEDYKYLVLYKYMNEELPPKSTDAPEYTDALYTVVGEFDPTKNFTYCFKDIDSDGYAELFLTENSNRIYALFTIKDKQPVCVRIFAQGMCYLTDSGTLFYNVKGFGEDGGQISLGYNIASLVGGELVGFEYGWEGDLYFRTDESGERTVITYDEYKTFKIPYNYFWEASTRLTKLADLKPYPTLTADPLTDKTADFSTYSAIINTLAVMSTEVTGGKWVRSKWIGGTYDEGMLFASDEDFVIYNRIFAACVLVQKQENATFGYARRDLDSDGTEELILLDSVYNVLAIFTESEGRAVLVDSFDDFRTAFIDKDGLVHVKQRIHPGNEADTEYTVYALRGSEIEVRLTVGVKCDANDNPTSYYKTVGTEAVAIDAAEYEGLYAGFAIDIGTSGYATYTKNNAALSFTAAE